jgi:hypothetical protein
VDVAKPGRFKRAHGFKGLLPRKRPVICIENQVSLVVKLKQRPQFGFGNIQDFGRGRDNPLLFPPSRFPPRFGRLPGDKVVHQAHVHENIVNNARISQCLPVSVQY